VSCAAARFHWCLGSNCEIDLPLKCIDANNEDAYLIADAESFPRSSANQLPSRRLE
jgi:hypothetical protein